MLTDNDHTTSTLLDLISNDPNAKEPPPAVTEYLCSEVGVVNEPSAKIIYNVVIMYRDTYGLNDIPPTLYDIITTITLLEAQEGTPNGN